MTDLIRAARERLAQELSAHGEKLQKLEADLTKLRAQHQLLGLETEQRWEEISRAGEAAGQVSPDAALENVLGAVRGLMTCTIPEQVLQILTEEACQLGVRAAVFDVRGKAAWGAAANGFGPELTERVYRSLVIPLNQENPFRQVCETAGHVDASADSLKRNRNLLDKLKPAPEATILLLPVRSGGTVSAIFYADPGEKGSALPVNALKILSEFAGAQLDRLIALSGSPSQEMDEEAERHSESAATVAEPATEIIEEPAAAAEPVPAEPAAMASGAAAVEETSTLRSTYPPVEVIPAVEPPSPAAETPAPTAEESFQAVEELPAASPVMESEPTPEEVVPQSVVAAPPPAAEVPVANQVAAAAPSPAPPAPAGFDITTLSEAEQKLHKDAKRFARLLVSEIELYNKVKVADGRKNRDLYRRMKSDIDRSRQTFDKRFGKTLGKEFDYFYDELVKTLAANDSSVLGPGYPGPTA
jgi:hypothetical protein